VVVVAVHFKVAARVLVVIVILYQVKLLVVVLAQKRH
jgi:hypothetical protein